MVSIKKVVKLTHFEKNRKNTFLVNAKKWKKWEKWSSKWNHQKVALTNCHYFVNSDPHAKIEEVLTRRFVERESFQQKGTCIIFIVLLHGRGPYPSLIAFFATRDHLAGQVCVPPALRDLSCFREKFFLSPLPHLRSVTLEKSPSWNVRIHFAPYGRNGEAHFFFSLNFFSEQFTYKITMVLSEICRVQLRLRLFSRHWCSNNRTTWDSHSDTVSILKILMWFFFAVFRKIN